MKFFAHKNTLLAIDCNKLNNVSRYKLEKLLYAYCCQGFRDIIIKGIVQKSDLSQTFVSRLNYLYNLSVVIWDYRSLHELRERSEKKQYIIEIILFSEPAQWSINLYAVLQSLQKNKLNCDQVYEYNNAVRAIVLNNYSQNTTNVEGGVTHLQNFKLQKIPLNMNQETKKCILIDRDGVINEDYGYVFKYEEFDYLPGVFEFLNIVKAMNYRIFIVTNQSGIGRGYYSENDFKELSNLMLNDFLDKNILIDYLLYAPYFRNSKIMRFRMNSVFRKPAAGMFNFITTNWKIDPAQTVMIGNSPSDSKFATNLSLRYFSVPQMSFEKILDKLNDEHTK